MVPVPILNPSASAREPGPGLETSSCADLRRGLTIRIVAISSVVALVLVPVRAKTVGFWFLPTLLDWSYQLPLALATAVYDVVFVLGLATVGVGVLWLPAMRRPARARGTYRVFLGAAIFTLAAGLTNISVVAWLGQPFTFQWLYFSDFFRSTEAIVAIAAAVPWWHAVAALTVFVMSGVGLARFGRWAESLAQRRRGLRKLFFAGLGLTLIYVIGAHVWIVRLGWSSGIVSNPLWSFAKSCVLAVRSPGVFSMKTPLGAEDFSAPPPLPAGRPASLLPADRPATRNVIFFVLESVAAQYVGLWGAGHGVTPELDRQRGNAALFTNAYAHAPATNLTLVTMLNGVYPRVSFRATTSYKPDIALRGIGETLRTRGYTTAFFASASLNYHRAGEYLAASHDFDLIEDSTGRAAVAGAAPSRWDAMAGSEDRATVESLIHWIDGNGARPFFATLWTNQTHFPYLVAGETRELAEKADFNRYLNALAEVDRAFGRLMSWLEETGRARDTLVVVLGDHGEAFGQHRNYGHAGHVYEENVHIPLLLIQPGLFHGESHDTVGGVVDIVPTVAEILRLPADAGWQGRSLFSTQRTGRVYFFAAWSDFLMGYREGNVKKIYNAAIDRHVVYDLLVDPAEMNDVAAAHPGDATREVTERVAAWVQCVERAYRPLLESK